MFNDGKSKTKLIIVRINVTVHAHDFPLSNPHARTKDIAPNAIVIPPIAAKIAPSASPSPIIMPIPIEPIRVPKNAPNAIAITPEIISSIARIVTPVGLTLADI